MTTPLCGCYYLLPPAEQWEPPTRQYFPQVDLSSHTSIIGSTSRTNLTQTFINPSDKPVDEIHYAFPLYDGVSVVAFSCTIGERVINGVVKETGKAKHDYDEAKEQGHTAALMEQSLDASDVFSTTIGNIPANAKLVINITYLGELKHDAQVDGLRFTIPTTIAPRYGQSSVSSTKVHKESMSITVDVQLPEGSAVKAVQSPSHPIAVNIGTISTNSEADPSLSRASASLSLDTTTLGGDFILQVVATKLDEPTALLETHPTLPNQRAIMATLVPKFNLPLEKPEIVFICDRSGSMYNSIAPLIQSLQVFLKSLPVGVKFNICSFGSSYSFLWPKSKTYDQASVDEASKYVSSFAANMGGTEMFAPVEQAFKQRYKDMNLEVFLLTDGEIWDQEKLFDMINTQVAKSKGAIRVFSLGIGSGGDGASSSLVEGIARAGNGFAQMVSVDEKLDKKIVRMLKGSLFPHVNDYTLEVTYGTASEPPAYDEKDVNEKDPDEFVLVDKIADALTISVEVDDKSYKKDHAEQRLISLFDRSHKADDSTKSPEESKYDHLPAVPVPHYLQAPHKIPALFPFNRTTVYVLLSDGAPHKVPSSVVLRATSSHGPLQLEIPVTAVSEPGTTLHQLAARQEVKDLEEGRGWLSFAKDQAGVPLKTKFPGRFQDMVEREAVRLGVVYQIVGKWTSFIAVDSDGPIVQANIADDLCVKEGSTRSRGQPMRKGVPKLSLLKSRGGANFLMRRSSPSQAPRAAPGFMSFAPSGGPPAPPVPMPAPASVSVPPPPGMADCSVTATVADSRDAVIERGEKLDHLQQQTDRLSSSASEFRRQAEALARESNAHNSSIFDGLGGFFSRKKEKQSATADAASVSEPPKPAKVSTRSVAAVNVNTNPLAELTSLQAFDGSWSWSPALEDVLGVSSTKAAKVKLSDKVRQSPSFETVLATACVVAFFKARLADDAEAWEMMADKAVEWIESQVGAGEEVLSAMDGLF